MEILRFLQPQKRSVLHLQKSKCNLERHLFYNKRRYFGWIEQQRQYFTLNHIKYFRGDVTCILKVNKLESRYCYANGSLISLHSTVYFLVLLRNIHYIKGYFYFYFIIFVCVWSSCCYKEEKFYPFWKLFCHVMLILLLWTFQNINIK